MVELAAASGTGARAGTTALRVFENPLNANVLTAHASGPRRLATLHESMGWTAHTTLRAAVKRLIHLGALESIEVGDRKACENRLTAMGEDLVFLLATLEEWLENAPGGPIPFDGEGAKGAIKALSGGWTSAIIRELATKPRSLNELDGLIPDVSYPTLERRVAQMRAFDQVASIETGGRSKSYRVTDWLRRSIAPLCAAARCEHRHIKEIAPPITEVEVEAAFLLAVPIAPQLGDLHGSCALAVHGSAAAPSAGHRALAGVTVEVQHGEAISCSTRVAREPSTWVLGAGADWLDAVIDGKPGVLRVGGARPELAERLWTALHLALFEDRKGHR